MKSNLKNRFGQHVKQEQLLQMGDRVLVAVSGGLDSVVLLDLLLKWQRRFRLKIGVVHLDHQLRGIDSQKDAAFVKALAETHQLPLHLFSENIAGFAKANHYSLEEAGHIRRTQLFEKTAYEKGYDKIATGHHLNDQAETILMRILSGTGITGLAGIRSKAGYWIRPLLFAGRDQILQYARQNNLQYSEDETNADIRFERNKIRKKLLPVLKNEYNKNADQHLANIAEIFSEWDIFQKNELQKVLKNEQLKLSEKKITIEISAFQGYFSWFKMYLIQYILKELENMPISLNSAKLKAFQSWLDEAGRNSEFDWGKKLYSYIEGCNLVFAVHRPRQVGKSEIQVLPEEVIKMDDGHEFVIERVEKKQVKFGESGVEFLNGENLVFPLQIRPWQPADRFKPLGLKGSKLVSDFLTDLKIRRFEKKEILVLMSGSEIVAVLGHRISEDYKLDNNSKIIYRITYK